MTSMQYFYVVSISAIFLFIAVGLPTTAADDQSDSNVIQMYDTVDGDEPSDGHTDPDNPDTNNSPHGEDHSNPDEDQNESNSSHRGDHYGYTRNNGPAKWAHIFHTCGGNHQSPINLDTTTAVQAHKPIQNWWGYSLRPTAMSLVNNGHTVVLKGEWADDAIPYNWAQDVDDVYVFEQLHFHWGPNDNSGSEHTLNSEKFPLEMHAVHYRRSLGSIGEAAKVPGGLKVIGILFRISEHSNLGLNDVLVGLPQVHNSLLPIDLPPFVLSKLMPQFSKQYLTYNGSLTTPPCSESVKWVVYKQAVTIAKHQVDKFRHFINEGTVVNRNYRPTQALNDRTVHHIR